MALDAPRSRQPHQWPLPNVWMGTSIELDRIRTPRRLPARNPGRRPVPVAWSRFSGRSPSLDLTGIDWVILGGESGPGARRMDLGWVRT